MFSDELDRRKCHTSGPCYLLSAAICPLLLRTSLNSHLFPLEDVFLTGLMVNKSGLQKSLHDIPNFLTDQFSRMDSSSLKQWVALHSVNTSTMYRLWYSNTNL